jgi:Xaa-Pro aminopeptidase
MNLGQPQPYFQTDFPIAEFAARRARLAEAIGNGAVAILQGARSTGAFDIFRQTNDFYYLSGVEVPHAYLLIEGGSARTTLYLPPHDPRHEASEGKQLNGDESEIAIQVTGVDDARPISALAADVRQAVVIYTPLSPGETRQACRDTLLYAQKQIAADPWDARPTNEQRFRSLLQETNPTAEYRDLSPFLDRLRMIKSSLEIGIMRKAGKLTALAVTEAMRSTQPGLMEYHLGAIADYIYLLNGARGGSYRPIIACGANIWNGHYYRNNCPLMDGELVLMDYAPDYGCYTSDIGRYWPVNGRYSALQRELYGFIVEYHKTLLGLIRPGVTPAQVMAEAAQVMESRIEAANWSKPIYKEAARRTLTFQGHLSHSVGMAVHDGGSYYGTPLLPGAVFALDPQMWIPEEKLYIRVEDTVVVTENGVENLTSLAPLELDDVEKTMQETGIIETHPPLNRIVQT